MITLDIQNPSFEQPVLGDGLFVSGSVPEWEDFGGGITSGVGVFNPPGSEPIPPNGENVLFFQSGPQYIVQDLEVLGGGFLSVKPGDSINIQLMAHDRTDAASKSISVDIRDSTNTSVVGGSQTLSVVNTLDYSLLSFDFVVDTTAATVNLVLATNFSSGQINVDNVSATANIVPEPKSVALLTICLALCLIPSYKKFIGVKLQ